MTKLLGSVALIAIATSSLSAENLSDVESANQAHTESTTPPPTEVLKSKESKSGFFLGVEMGAGSVKITQNTSLAGGYDSLINETKTLFDMGLKFGYQHYFGESQNHGIRVGLGIGSAVPPIDSKDTAKRKELINANPPAYENWLYESTYKIIPMKVSFELDYLWDFFNRGSHTIGLDVGLGYEMGVWFGKTTGSSLYQDKNVQYSAEGKATTLLNHTIYPKIGIHYYYGNHQFNLAYKFGGILNGTKAKNRDGLDWVGDGQSASVPDSLDQSIQSSPSYISFGYSYRF